jgi:catechol 2,3-dioxygenase-like lactoylglutathione lyase family enzyme
MPQVASISIYVTDMEASIAFYRDVLGFGVKSRPVPFITELDHDGAALVLCQAEKGAKLDYPASSGTVIGLVSTNVAAAAKGFAKQQVPMVVAEPQEFPGGKFIAVRDPSGNVVELLQSGA